MDRKVMAIMVVLIASTSMLTLGCTGSTTSPMPSKAPAATAMQGTDNYTGAVSSHMNATWRHGFNGTRPGFNGSFNGTYMHRPGFNGTWRQDFNGTPPDFNGTYGGPGRRGYNGTWPGPDMPTSDQG